jgi:hypothetical protein
MSGIAAAETETWSVEPVASMRHFAVLVTLFLALTVSGALYQSAGVSSITSGKAGCAAPERRCVR